MSHIYLTLDYEFFFGLRSGSVQRCMIEPTERLIEIGHKRGVRFTFFVDSGMLHRMSCERKKNREVAVQYSLISDQLRKLVDLGHSVQLHIHPHWEDSTFDSSGWRFNTTRYRLAHFDKVSVLGICENYYDALACIVGKEEIRAYRAGGWCIHPFSQIDAFLRTKEIRVDSSVFPGGFLDTATHYFDFRSVQNGSRWRFEDDPLVPCVNGFFEEIPMSTVNYTRSFYLMMVVYRLLRLKKYRFLGDGSAIGGGKRRTIDRILKGDSDVLTLDGVRSNVALASIKKAVDMGEDRVIISHPKALCDRSFEVLDRMASRFSSNFEIM